MKKKLLITLAAGVLMITSVAAGAYGATNLQAIKVNLNLGLKFKVDGENWTPKDASGKNVYAITYNGATYLPIRTAGEALGVEVGWDGANNAVWLGDGAAVIEGRKASSYDVDVKVENGPMVMNISKVSFNPAYNESEYSSESQAVIILDVSVENTSSEKAEWYVNQTQLVLDTKEQIESALVADGYISSEFNGQVIKSGKIIFPVKNSKFEDITTIRVLTKYVLDGNMDRIAEDREVTINLK